MKNHSNNWQEIDVKKLFPAKWNYKEQDNVLDEKLAEGIKKNGMLQNLIVRQVGEKFEVVNGNHRLPIVEQLGHKTVMCYNLGKVPLAMAQKIAIETNEISYETNQLKLAGLIRDISKHFSVDELLTTMPYEPEHMKSMLEVPKFDLSQYTNHEGFNPPTVKIDGPDGPMTLEPTAINQGVDENSPAPPTAVVQGGVAYEQVLIQKDVYRAFSDQLKRINKALAKEGFMSKEDIKSARNTMAIQVMVQMVAETSDASLAKVLKKTSSK